jgi:hypothetical protein
VRRINGGGWLRGSGSVLGQIHMGGGKMNSILTGNQSELDQIEINQKGENPMRTQLGHGLTRSGDALPECRVGLGLAQWQAALADAGR